MHGRPDPTPRNTDLQALALAKLIEAGLPRIDRGEHISSCARRFEHMLTRAHKRMDELGYPPVNHPIVRESEAA
ncbi:MAG TPA: hypothetical protein VIK05_13405 [Ilumatobacteraceae bacterium]|jgi:hypothetical protein